MAKPRFPLSRPNDIPLDVWEKLAAQPACSRLTECGQICQPIDQDGYYDVEVDHIISRDNGGANTLQNLRVVCKKFNRHKGARRDPDFSGEFYFDQPINVDALRQHQLELAYNIPQLSYRDLFLNDLSLVLNRILLFGWLMGAGKTVGVCAFLFGLNQLRAPFAARRARRVLWMVHQRQLVGLLATELGGTPDKKIPSDLVRLGIVPRAPDVHAPETAEALLARPHADIVCTCTQAFWDADNRALSTEQRQRVLSMFDVIVIDEGHFAIERYLEIMQAAPTAIKIIITATPMDADGTLLCDLEKPKPDAPGKYRDHFVLVSAFGYQTGRKEGIYKELLRFDKGVEDGRYISVEGGDGEVAMGENMMREQNTRERQNVQRTSAVCTLALRKALVLDQANHSPNQIMVRVDSRNKADKLAAELNENKEFASHGAIAVYSGVKGVMRLNSPENPWMRSAREGVLLPAPRGARILVCVDMGQFGLNNRFCSVIAWRDVPASLIELVQRIGRAIRAIGKSIADDGQYVVLIWRDGAMPGFEERLTLALDYILNLEERLERKFLTLAELRNPDVVKIDDPVGILETSEKIRLLSIAGNLPPDASPEDIANGFFTTAAEGEDPPEPSETKVRAVKDYIDTVINPPSNKPDAVKKSREARARMLGATLAPQQGNMLAPPNAGPRIIYVQNEAPPDVYTDEQLIAAVAEFTDLEKNASFWRDAVTSNNAIIKDMIAQRVKERDRAAYQAPKLRWRISQIIARNGTGVADGLVPPTPIAQRFWVDVLKPAGQKYELAARCVYIAAQNLLQVKPLKESHPRVAQYHVQIADALLDPRNQALVRGVALRVLLKQWPQAVPGLRKSFEDVIRDIPNVGDYADDTEGLDG